jgi:hypothetical protein
MSLFVGCWLSLILATSNPMYDQTRETNVARNAGMDTSLISSPWLYGLGRTVLVYWRNCQALFPRRQMLEIEYGVEGIYIERY